MEGSFSSRSDWAFYTLHRHLLVHNTVMIRLSMMSAACWRLLYSLLHSVEACWPVCASSDANDSQMSLPRIDVRLSNVYTQLKRRCGVWRKCRLTLCNIHTLHGHWEMRRTKHSEGAPCFSAGTDGTTTVRYRKERVWRERVSAERMKCRERRDIRRGPYVLFCKQTAYAYEISHRGCMFLKRPIPRFHWRNSMLMSYQKCKWIFFTSAHGNWFEFVYDLVSLNKTNRRAAIARMNEHFMCTLFIDT